MSQPLFLDCGLLAYILQYSKSHDAQYVCIPQIKIFSNWVSGTCTKAQKIEEVLKSSVILTGELWISSVICIDACFLSLILHYNCVKMLSFEELWLRVHGIYLKYILQLPVDPELFII